eukprot:1144591-Pelagomonas_calceolata.AAC.3
MHKESVPPSKEVMVMMAMRQRLKIVHHLSISGSENTPLINKEKRIPRAGALCVPFTKSSKKRMQWGSGGLLAVARA